MTDYDSYGLLTVQFPVGKNYAEIAIAYSYDKMVFSVRFNRMPLMVALYVDLATNPYTLDHYSLDRLGL